ncbi:unnamed protein product, partial [Ectocarpus sp. 8 AP-2014]
TRCELKELTNALHHAGEVGDISATRGSRECRTWTCEPRAQIPSKTRCGGRRLQQSVSLLGPGVRLAARSRNLKFRSHPRGKSSALCRKVSKDMHKEADEKHAKRGKTNKNK